MGILSIILLVLFVIASLLLILLVLVQDEQGEGLGGIFGGNSDSAFGGRSNRVMNKITGWTVAVFVLLAVAVAFVNKSSDSSVLSSLNERAAATATTTDSSTN